MKDVGPVSPPPPPPEPDSLGLFGWHYGALERAIDYNNGMCAELMRAGNYDCQFYESDATALQEILTKLNSLKENGTSG